MPESNDKGLKQIISAAASLTRRQSRDVEETVQQVITEYRNEKRLNRG